MQISIGFECNRGTTIRTMNKYDRWIRWISRSYDIGLSKTGLYRYVFVVNGQTIQFFVVESKNFLFPLFGFK